MRDDQQTGKTTRLFEQAVELLGTIPETSTVFITGPHMNFLRQLEKDFQKEGLTGIRVVSPEQIRDGYCRGCRGVIMIDDPWDMSDSLWNAVEDEQRIMRRS